MKEKIYKYSVSNRIFDNKLGDGMLGIVHNSMITTESTVEQFGKKVSNPKAHSWCGGIFNGSIDDNNWIESSIIGMANLWV